MTVNIRTLLSSYPRVRPPLTPEHEKIYAEEYKKTRSDGEKKQPFTSRLVGPVRYWMHRKVARLNGRGIVLELGAGTLNHLPFEPSATSYDIVEPFAYLFEDHPQKARVRAVYKDIRDVQMETRYGRIISVAVLEHLTELPYTVAKSGLLLWPEGVFQAGIPAESGFLWGAAWRLSTGIAYKLRTGLDYKTLMRHEHINSAPEILTIVELCFEEVKVKYFPLPFLHGSLFLYIEARKPILESCRALVNHYESGIITNP